MMSDAKGESSYNEAALIEWSRKVKEAIEAAAALLYRKGFLKEAEAVRALLEK